MAHNIVDAFPTGLRKARGVAQKYDWDLLTDGQIHELDAAEILQEKLDGLTSEEVDKKLTNWRTQFSGQANQRGHGARTAYDAESKLVYVQATAEKRVRKAKDAELVDA
jgi:hypothetical protein